MNVELHADQDIIDALQAMKEKADQYSALLSVLRQCVEALAFVEPQYQRVIDLMRKVGWKFEDSDDLDQKVVFSVYTYLVECCQKAEASLAAARPYLERKEGGG